MILLARMIDPPARDVRKTYEEKVDEPMKQAYAKIAKARFAVNGTDTYPDATFTLRLAFGAVKGYQAGWQRRFRRGPRSAARSSMPTITASKPPFALPDTWLNPPQAR